MCPELTWYTLLWSLGWADQSNRFIFGVYGGGSGVDVGIGVGVGVLQAAAAISTLSETELDGRPILVREDREA